jgi:hypothetical protein
MGPPPEQVEPRHHQREEDRHKRERRLDRHVIGDEPDDWLEEGELRTEDQRRHAEDRGTAVARGLLVDGAIHR